MHFALVKTLITLAAITCAGSAPKPKSHETPDPVAQKNLELAKPSKSSEPTSVMLVILNIQIDEVDWVDKPLLEIFQWIRDQGRINIVPDWRTLRKIDVTPNTTITLTLQDVTVADVLIETLYQVSGFVRYRAIGNTLRISTVEDFAQDMYTKVYNLVDLGLIDVSLNLPPSKVVALIKAMISPDTWDIADGPGTILLMGQSSQLMIVTNSPEVHEAIGGRVDISDTIPAGKRKHKIITKPSNDR